LLWIFPRNNRARLFLFGSDRQILTLNQWTPPLILQSHHLFSLNNSVQLYEINISDSPRAPFYPHHLLSSDSTLAVSQLQFSPHLPFFRLLLAVFFSFLFLFFTRLS